MSNKVICFGEILFDVYPDGKKIGGAPFNVAAHLNQLGDDASIISRIGEDVDGNTILSEVTQFRMTTESIQLDSKLPTGLVNVILDDKGIPSYDIAYPSSWDKIAVTPEDIERVSEAEALVFGSLACRNGKSKSSLLKLADHSNLNICDLNIRQDYFNKPLLKTLLELSHVLKINDEEAELIRELFNIKEDGFHTSLGNKFGISVIIETKGAEGAVAYSGGRKAHALGLDIQPVDTVGSGDAFLASFIHHFLQHKSLEYCLREACKMGAYVATQKGAIPSYDEMPEDFG